MSNRRRIISPLRPRDKAMGFEDSGRDSSLSVRSISAFDHQPHHQPDEDEYDDEGAAIPDIPTRKSSRAQNIVDFITSPEAFKNVRRTKFKEDMNPHAQNLGVPQVSRPSSSSSNRDQPSSGRIANLRDQAPIERAPSPRAPQSPRSPRDQGPAERMTNVQDHEPAERAAAIRHYASAERLPSTRDYHTPQNRRRSVGPDDQLSVAQSTTQRSMFSSKSQMNSSSSSLFAPTSLPPLQTKGGDVDNLEPLAEEEVDPSSFDLVVPAHSLGKQYSLETQSELLFSVKHLGIIFDDPVLLQRFTTYLCAYRPQSVRILVYYLDALKALKAIQYANAVTEALAPIDGLDYTKASPAKTMNCGLKEKMTKAFETIANHDLPAYITHTYVQTVSLTIKRRIADTLPVHLRDMSEGLAEVFCLTDPSRPDNPIVFASEEFHKTTQYGMDYVLGRNCRFLQGPKTNPFSVQRIREKLLAGKEHVETFLNYRRDGSPFMNLLMVAPLFDSRGQVRYHIGAQVDVSGLVKESAGLESLERLVARENPELLPHHYQQPQSPTKPDHKRSRHAKFSADAVSVRTNGNGVEKTNGGDPQQSGGEIRDEFRELAAMFTMQELRTVRESGGALHRVHQEDISSTDNVANWRKPRVLIRDDMTLDRRDSDPVLHDTAAMYASGEAANAEAATFSPTNNNTNNGGGHRRIGSNGTDHNGKAASVHSSERIYMGPDPSSSSSANIGGGRLSGVYEHYLLVRPYPSLKILFASPSLRVPGMLQSSFLSRVGGSPRLRDAIETAFADGQGVTAKVRWLSSAATRSGGAASDEGRGRWIHATPLLGSNGAVGVWMVVLVDDEAEAARRLPREAPPVERYVNGRHPRFDGYTPSEDGMSLGGFAEEQQQHYQHYSQPPPPPRRGDNVGARRAPAVADNFAERERENTQEVRAPPMRNPNRARSEVSRIDSF